VTIEQTEATPDEGSTPALSETELAAMAPEVLANSLSDYLLATWRRVKGGESGMLPIILGLVAIVIFFQIERSAFLTNQNLVNLFEEAAIYVVLGAAETFVLLLSEIDLSIGYGAGVGAFVIAEMIAPPINFPWWLGILIGVAFVGFLGLIQGALVTRLGLPSFIVTLGGQLAFLGIMEEIANADPTAVGGSIQISPSSPVYKLVLDNMSPTLGWATLGVLLVIFAALSLNRSRSRRARGLHAEPLGVTLLKIVMVTVAGIVFVYVCNSNRSALAVVKGVPWVIPFVLVIIFAYSWLLSRTRTGRYIYAVGNNPEAARRAGIKVDRIVMFAFVMAGATAALAGLIYESTQSSMATDIDGGQLVLFAVAAAVIGGTALFGGRGRMVNALLGGLIIAVVYDGLALMGVAVAVENIATAIVLIAAVALDAVVRRRSKTR
jgi:D-xylose transport system permease protein